MSLIFLSSTDPESDKITEFNWDAIANKDNNEIKLIKNSLTLQYESGFGKILKRSDNSDLWFINSKDGIARLITEKQFELFKTWDENDLLPNKEQFQKLSEIGGLPSSEYSLVPRNIQFPAKITTVDNRQIDLCIFHFSEAPPFQRYFKKVIFLSEVAEIRESELSLPYNLRLASMLADEIRMSFYPFMVQTKNGGLITYNGATQFASNGKIKGSDIVGQIEFSYKNFTKEYHIPYEDITYVICKWDERSEKLFEKYQTKHEENNPIETLQLKKQSWWERFFANRKY